MALLRGHEDWVGGVSWSPDGRRIATASRDRTARVWEAVASFDELVAKARSRVSRGLTDDVRRQAMLPVLVGSALSARPADR